MKTFSLTLVATLAPAVLAHAGVPGQQCFSDEVPVTTTNWQEPLSVPQFNPAQGVLTGISILFESRVQGSIGTESLDGAPASVTLNYGANLQLLDGSMNILVALSPNAAFVHALTAFDGVIDFGGTSGVTHAGLDLMDSGGAMPALTPAVLATFVGLGTVPFQATATGASTVSGPGNIVSQFLTNASARVTVCYTFAPDCNANGISDTTDITSGTSLDNNNDGIPDECQGPDCNGNLIPDFSDIASGTSLDANQDGIPDECQVVAQGCTPGYWKNHPESWAATGFNPTDDFDTVFGVNAWNPNQSLMTTLKRGGGDCIALGRHAVAALLSASHAGVAYPIDAAAVILLVQNAFANGDCGPAHNLLASYNEAGCPLN
jgi:hypothetical protein